MISHIVTSILTILLGMATHAENPITEHPITDARVVFDIEASADLVASINGYLERFIGKEASSEHRRLAEDFLRTLYVVLSTDCSYRKNPQGRSLICSITAKRTVRAITVKNLPVSLLESELKRRLSIEVGQTIDVDGSISDLLGVIKGRVDTFLRKNGYYDAKVIVTHDAPARASWTDITIEIVGGVFVRVNTITVSGDSPFTPSSIKKQFSRMCFSFNRIMESISMGTLGCYSRELEGDTVLALQDRLAKMGYVQSQVRVSHYWVAPSDKDAPSDCRAVDGKTASMRCINLRVHIEKGPLFRWNVTVKDRLSISRNALVRFITSIFSVDQLSRAATSERTDEIALDHMIIEEELENKVTFISAKNVDEQELSESAQDITEFLVQHGYANALVIPKLVQEDEANVVVNFDVYADRPFFVESVGILPDSYNAYVSEEYLQSLVADRSFTANGNLAYSAIEGAKADLLNHLKARGFRDVQITLDLETTPKGAVNVLFNLSESKRETIEEVIVLNGLTALNEEILPLLHNCDAYEPARRHMPVRKLCPMSSFVPERLDEDALRIADFYQNAGYLYAKVVHETVESKDGRTIIFTIFDSRLGEKSLTPLTSQTIKDIIVSGNRTTSADAIKRLFPRKLGHDLLEPNGIKMGLARLRESGRFSRIDSKIMFGQEHSDDAYYLLQVAERPSLSIDTSIAFSTDQHFSLETELEEGNLFASMLKLNTNLALGLFWGRQSIFSNKLIWPYILGRPLRLTINAPIIVYEDRLHLASPSRRLQSKLSFRLEWRSTPRVTPYLEYWLVFTQEDIFSASRLPSQNVTSMLRSLDGLIPTIRTKGSIQGVLKPGIAFVQLDNPFDPRSGVDVNLWTELSGGPLLGRPPFVNLGIQNRFFVPIGPLTLALQATFMRAFIEPSEANWKKLRNVSEMDKLGGDRSVRGYDQDAIGLDHFDGPISRYSGYFANLANAEIRFPLTTKSAIGNFSGAFFVDEGMVIPCGAFFKCLDKRTFNRLATSRAMGLSVGAALRYSLPVGPISLDYGVSPITGDNRVHILFGYSF